MPRPLLAPTPEAPASPWSSVPFPSPDPVILSSTPGVPWTSAGRGQPWYFRCLNTRAAPTAGRGCLQAAGQDPRPRGRGPGRLPLGSVFSTEFSHGQDTAQGARLESARGCAGGGGGGEGGGAMWPWLAAGAWPRPQSLQGIGGGGLTDASSAGDSECFAWTATFPGPERVRRLGLPRAGWLMPPARARRSR